MYLSMIPAPYKLFKLPSAAYHFYVINLFKIIRAKYSDTNVFLDKARKKKVAAGREFITNEEFNDMIKQRIQSGSPFFCCRYGNSEWTACFTALLKQEGIIDQISEENLHKLKSGPGVFPPCDEMYLAFAQKYTKAMESADLNAYWGSVLMEEYLIEKYQRKDCLQYAMRALEPFQYDEPWTLVLKGKKVLVVHPFAEIVESQYKRRHEIFPHKEILPEFEMHVVKAIQSSGETYPEGYSNWCDALDSVYRNCMEKDFDVALLSCGSYAVPLGAMLKQAGKQVIVPGGMLQLMFGIKGTRWEQSRPDIVAMYNDAWIRAGGVRCKRLREDGRWRCLLVNTLEVVMYARL